MKLSDMPLLSGGRMKRIMEVCKNSKGVVMLVTVLVILSVTAVSVAMITNAALSSTMAKNYRSTIQSFYASDGRMTLLAQAVLDTADSNYFPLVRQAWAIPFGRYRGVPAETKFRRAWSATNRTIRMKVRDMQRKMSATIMTGYNMTLDKQGV